MHLQNPQGVCIPNIILFEFPEGVPTVALPDTPFEFLFSVLAGDETPKNVLVVLTVDGTSSNLVTTPLGNDLYSATFPEFSCENIVSFYITVTGDGGSVREFAF